MAEKQEREIYGKKVLTRPQYEQTLGLKHAKSKQGLVRSLSKLQKENYQYIQDVRNTRNQLHPRNMSQIRRDLKRDRREEKLMQRESEQRNKAEYKEAQRLQSVQRYSSRSGRFGNAISRGLKTISRPHGITQAAYNRGKPQTYYGSNVNGGKGRPRGSYDKRYAQFGGVYGYRKYIALRNRQLSAQTQMNSQLSPQEQQTLMQIRNAQMQRQGNPEGRMFPDTSGRSSVGSFNQEIDDAANLFP